MLKKRIEKEKEIEITQQAQSLIKKGEYKEAEKLLKGYMEKYESPKFRSLLVKSYMTQEKYSECLEEVSKATKEYPYDLFFIGQKTEALTLNKKREEAKKLLEFLLKYDLIDRRLLLQLKSIYTGEDNEVEANEIEKKIQEKNIEIKKSRQNFNINITNKYIEKIQMRKKIYDKKIAMREKIDLLNIREILENEGITKKDIKEVADYYLGTTRFGILEERIKLEDIEKIKDAYKKIGETKEGENFLEEIQSHSEKFSTEELKRIKDMKNKIEDKDFNNYIFTIKKDIRANFIKPTDIVGIINEMSKFQGKTHEKRILAIKLFDLVGYRTYKTEAIEKAIRKASNKEEKNIIEKAIEILEEEKRVDDKEEVTEEDIGGR